MYEVESVVDVVELMVMYYFGIYLIVEIDFDC